MTRNSTGRLDVVVIGAGIVGLATAFKLLEQNPGLSVAVLEAEARVGAHQSSHNSGVLHAGVYYAPGSLKARMCGRGRSMLIEYASERGIPVERSGKVVVATSADQVPALEELWRRASANQVPGLARLDAAGVAALEPAITAVAGLHSPATAVVDFGAVTRALATDVGQLAQILTSTRVTSIEDRGSTVRLAATTPTGELQLSAKRVVVCAGLQSDRLARMTGDDDGIDIIGFRGSWSLLAPPLADQIRGNVYPVPDPRFPFLGVHLTRRSPEQVWVGPNAVLASGRHAYSPGRGSGRDLWDAARSPGLARLAARHATTGAREWLRDRSVALYVRDVQRLLPSVTRADLLPGPSGIRAQAVRRDGSMVEDFHLSEHGRVLHVRNAPSPAATASLAIGEELARRVMQRRRS